MIRIPNFSLKYFLNSRTVITIYLVIMCTQIVAIEGGGVSIVKVALMAVAPLFFIFKTPYITKALIWGILYWLFCFLCALLHGNLRFSTIGYLGMFIVTYVVFYCILYRGAISLDYFANLLRILIILFSAVLILQQVAMLVGIRSLAIINLSQGFMLNKLPSLTIEPSHTARITTVMMLCYMRCIELKNRGNKPTLAMLLSKEHRIVTLLFLWLMLTMGSGTAFIGLAILSLYFIQRNSIIYIIPLFVFLVYFVQSMEMTNAERAIRMAKAAATGNIEAIQDADGSGAIRVIPVINTLTIDLTQKESWVGKGTFSYEEALTGWMRTTDKIAVVEQYGLIALILSLMLVYSCAIKKFFSLETLIFVFLLGGSLSNIAYVWGILMIFTCMRYFQELYLQGQIGDNERN